MEKNAPDLFAPVEIGPYILNNRIVMAPMTRNRAGDGNVPRELNATYYEQRASAGLIITEASQISPQGVGYPACLCLARGSSGVDICHGPAKALARFGHRCECRPARYLVVSFASADRRISQMTFRVTASR